MTGLSKDTHGERIIDMPPMLSVDEVDNFRKLINSLLEQGEKNFVLNFNHCEFIDSTGLGVIVAIHKKCLDSSGSLRLKALKPQILKLFHMTRLDRVFDIA